jgi:hypothetical protein
MLKECSWVSGESVYCAKNTTPKRGDAGVRGSEAIYGWPFFKLKTKPMKITVEKIKRELKKRDIHLMDGGHYDLLIKNVKEIVEELIKNKGK